MNARFAAGAALLATATWLATTSVQATLLPKIEFNELCRTSSQIVVATCTSRACSWDKSGSAIITTYRLAVSETLSGATTSAVEVVALGGRVGKKAMAVAGAPSFRDGEEYVLFLERNRDGTLSCRGWTQGRYEVYRDAATGARSVRGDTSGAALMRRGRGKVEEGGPGKPMTLSSFLDEVRAATTGQGEAK